MTEAKAVLISCVSSKQNVAAPAIELYTSNLFKASAAYAKSLGLPIWIISAEHGLLESSRIIEPYDKTLNKMSAADVKAWHKMVAEQIQDTFPSDEPLMVLAGKKYLGFKGLVPNAIEDPLEGLPLGKRVQWLKANTQSKPVTKPLKLSKKEQAFIDQAKEIGYPLERMQTSGGERGIIRAFRITTEGLQANGWNPNEMKPRTAKAVVESLDHYGQVLECVACVNPKEGPLLTIVDGEHRSLAMEPGATVSCNVLFGYTKAETKKLTVILNETRGKANKVKLSALLDDLDLDADKLAIGLPYEKSEIDELLSINRVDWDDFGSDDDDDTEVDDDEAAPESEEFIVAIPPEQLIYITQAIAKVEDSEDVNLGKDDPEIWGNLLVRLCERYLDQGDDTDDEE